MTDDAGNATRRVNPFGEGVGYVRIKLSNLMQRAQDARYDRATRVEFACLAECNRDGHAQFERDELANILGKMHNGQWAPASRSRVSDAIATAKARGGIGPESTTRCLVAPAGAVSQGRGDRGCRVHNFRSNGTVRPDCSGETEQSVPD